MLSSTRLSLVTHSTCFLFLFYFLPSDVWSQTLEYINVANDFSKRVCHRLAAPSTRVSRDSNNSLWLYPRWVQAKCLYHGTKPFFAVWYILLVVIFSQRVVDEGQLCVCVCLCLASAHVYINSLRHSFTLCKTLSSPCMTTGFISTAPNLCLVMHILTVMIAECSSKAELVWCAKLEKD